MIIKSYFSYIFLAFVSVVVPMVALGQYSEIGPLMTALFHLHNDYGF